MAFHQSAAKVFLNMHSAFIVKRTTTHDADFELLVAQLDHELWYELGEDQATYDQYNKVVHIKTAVVVYADGQPVAIGCFKEFTPDTVEIKRMFVQKAFRGMGISKMVLTALEQWAVEKGYSFAVLETSIHFETAKNLYRSNGYAVIPNYAQYADMEESICMRKQLIKAI